MASRPAGWLEELLASGELHELARDCADENDLARKLGVSQNAIYQVRRRANLAGRWFPTFAEMKAGWPPLLEPSSRRVGTGEIVEAIPEDFADEEPTQPGAPAAGGCMTPGRYSPDCNCTYCRRRRRELEHEERSEGRRTSDFEAMRPEDFAREFDTSVSNNKAETPADRAARSRAAKEKRQEFNRQMGEFAMDLRDSTEHAARGDGSIGEIMPPRHAQYIGALAEQERRFGNRRWARSIAIAEAHEQLSREAMIYVADTFFRDKVTPTGYARFAKPETPMKRTACLLLSDLHLGSELDALDEPVAFGAIEEARRLEFILRQFLDFKPQYRDNTEALIIINGDIIEGNLLHDLRSGAPLTEQKAIFWSYFVAFISLVAQVYKSVRIVCQPGNHGRDKLRHPGRATSSKWDGHEWSMFYALRQMCAGLLNVKWSIPFRAVSIVDLHGQNLLVTHADTELKLGDPDTKILENARSFDRINSTRIYGCEFAGGAFGHYHKPRFQPRRPDMLWNAALVPPNGHARTSGYIGEPCGQWMWESVEGHLFGDLRFLEVGRAQDHDERLGTLIKPFRFSMFPEAA